MKTRILVLSLSIIMISCSGTDRRKETGIRDDVVLPGMEMPGDSLEIFMPGIISCPGTHEGALTISPSGDEIFFARGIWPNTRILALRWDGKTWTEPDTADFSRKYLASEPAFSPDGQYVYFSSSLEKSDSSSYSICRVSRKAEGWSEPEHLFDPGADTIWEFHPSVTADSLLYFCRWSAAASSGKIYYSGLSAGKFTDPVPAEQYMNSDSSDVDPFISADGSFVIFSSTRPGGKGNFDQYIAFRNISGGWDEPQNMGASYNTEGEDFDMDLTSDGKYMFVYRNGDIFWKRSEQFKNQNN